MSLVHEPPDSGTPAKCTPQRAPRNVRRTPEMIGCRQAEPAGRHPHTGTMSQREAALSIQIGTAFAFSVATLRYFPRYPRWLLDMGVLIAGEDMVWSLVLN
jgi:hypothetical protein